jgi:SNF2 family DNA or RNA helicase
LEKLISEIQPEVDRERCECEHKFKYSLSSIGFLHFSYLHIVASDRTVVEVNIPIESEVDLKMQNIMMLLRKCCNHPYLIEYPIDPVTQEFKVNVI